MTLANFESSFVSVLPRMRSFSEIDADLAVASSGATGASKAMIARIESHIHQGDDLYTRRQYLGALNEFKQARAMIYSILYPDFHVGGYLRGKELMLPLSPAIEKSLMDASVRLTDAIRPLDITPQPVIRREMQEQVPDSLKPMVTVGFRESKPDEIAQLATSQGVSLLQDQKPQAAADVMEDALARAGAQLNPALKAALQLNIAAAHLQSGDTQNGSKFAGLALEQFKAAQDPVGQAQALHLSGVSLQKSGNTAAAKPLFQQASDLLDRKGGAAVAVELPPATQPHVAPRVIAAAPAGRPTGVAPAGVGLAPALTVGSTLRISQNILALEPVAKMDAQAISFRISGRESGWGVLPLVTDQQRQEQAKTWQIGVPAGEKFASFSVGGGQLPTVAESISALYQPRINAVNLRDLGLQIVDTSSTTFYLTHLYSYVLPVKLGDCYHQLGQFAHAEENYQQATGYSFLNRSIEATALWLRIARNAVEWGDTIYRAEDLPNAKIQYSKLVTENAGVPAASLLYSAGSLATPANSAKALIQNLAKRPVPEIHGEIAIVVFTAFSRLQQIAQNLDFYGLLLSPIHTFEYLQSVARGFAQEASQAEQQFINFKSRQEAAEATRRDLETTSAMAHAEADARFQQFQSAQDDIVAAQAALDLAQRRVADAQKQKNQYAAQSSAQIWGQAAAQALSAGQDAMYDEISQLADKLARGETISGPGGKLAAAETLYAGRKTQAYELQKMQDNIDELQKAIPIAQAQLTSASARVKSAEIEWQAALQRASLADASLAAFDNDFFTPETWQKMSDIMRDISRSYLHRGIGIAKLMERAYNFDNDTQLKIIKSDYGYSVANPGAGRNTILLGGDSLLADIESFTFQAITNKTRKNSRIKDVLSIATNFPAQFDEFRSTGLLSFETDLYEFDRLHPGFYGQRLESVEVELIGLLPENSGVEGTLTAGGVSSLRKRDGTSGKRVHQVDTMALSNFTLRGDVFLYSTETGVRGLFQGLGLGTTWQLHLPKRSNAFDFRRIFDVNIVFYYTALYDQGLRTAILAKPVRPGELDLLRTFALRYDFPDAWYGFYRQGSAKFSLERTRLPFNQQNFKVKSAQFRVVTKLGISNQNIVLRITGPNGFTGQATTDKDGLVSSTGPLAGLVGTTPIGDWQIAVTGGPSIMDGSTPKPDRIYNIQLGLEYSYEYVPEVM